jgi:hypothetical protein
MAPWDVPGYSKPIPRRIAEEAGIPRNVFGMSKQAASVLFDARIDSLSSATRDEYYKWLRRNTAGQSLYVGGRLVERFPWPYKTMLRGVRKAGRMAPESLKEKGQKLIRWSESHERKFNLFRYAFPWAIEKAKERYKAYHKRNSRIMDTAQ